MHRKKAFTLIELLVVIAVIAVLMGILMPALGRARELGKRGVCLGHIKQLQLAWTVYAGENDDKLVNGDTEEYPNAHKNERPWVMKDWAKDATLEQKKKSIEKGALYPYCNNIKAYHCPTGTISKTEMRMYAVVDSMNVAGADTPGCWHNGGGSSLTKGSKMIKIFSRIKNTSQRIVFMDDGGTGGMTMGGYTFYTTSESFCDPPPIRHGNGTIFSFADGHAEYWKWEDERTVDLAERCRNEGRPIRGEVQEGNPDIRKLRIAIWGPGFAQMP